MRPTIVQEIATLTRLRPASPESREAEFGKALAPLGDGASTQALPGGSPSGPYAYRDLAV